MEEKEKNITEESAGTDKQVTPGDPAKDAGVQEQEPDLSQYSIEEVKEEAIKAIRTCYDPEIPVNVYDLGLIYDIIVATNKDVMVLMTLTSPACPVAGTLPGEVEQKLREHPMIHDAKVELTFDPPWNQDMMSEEAKLELGFL